MRVGVVAYEMEGQPTGVGRYLEGLLSGIRSLGAEGRWLLFFKGEPFEHPLWSDGSSTFQPIFAGRPGARPILWEQLALPRQLSAHRLDALFSPAYSLPETRLPGLLTLHDLSFEHLPEEFSWKERWRRRLLARRAARRAARVLADTRQMAADLERTYGVPREKIGIVTPAVEARFATVSPSAEAALGELGVRPPYLLYAGSILPRRRLDLLIEAFGQLAGEHPELQLVLVGRNRLPRPRELDGWLTQSPVADRILRLGYVDDPSLSALYGRALVAVYLSTYEGFGLPPLEALASGTPVVVSGGMALDDLWPDYPLRTAALEVESVTTALRRAVESPELCQGITAAAPDRLAGLTWERAAESFLRELAKAGGR